MIRADIGAYVRTAALVPAEFGAALLPGPYRMPDYACDLWSVVTNKTPVGTLRSPGRPECNFARERLLDTAAARLGLDPADHPTSKPRPSRRDALGLRHRLLRREDGLRLRATSPPSSSACWSGSTTRARGPSSARRRRGQRAWASAWPCTWRRRGSGPFETARVEARPDGRFRVDTGASSMGPGPRDRAGPDPRLRARPARRPLRGAASRHRRHRERRGHLRLAGHRHRRQRRADGGGQARGGRAQPRRDPRWASPRTRSSTPRAPARRGDAGSASPSSPPRRRSPPAPPSACPS